MLENIKIIEIGIRVDQIVESLKRHPEDWNSQSNSPNARSVIDEFGFPKVEVDVLQLVIGAIKNPGEYVGDSELSQPLPAHIQHHQAVFDAMGRDRFPHVSRCGFLRLPPGGSVGQHIDVGSYYLTRDRYHLSIMGQYRYTVGDESIEILPGTLFWFNNKLPHGTKVISTCPRITFVFDVEQPSYISRFTSGRK